MIKSKIGPVTAYADAVQAGYTGTREEFGRQQAEFAKNAAKVEQAKTEVNQTVVDFTQTAQTAKEDIVAEGERQVQRIEDIAPDLSLDREQIASNTAGVEEAKAAAEEAKTIAKGRATGYVFDTIEDMETWLASEKSTQNLVLGDNLYIRATDVPDYWWDGNQAQPLETQKVDMEEYVKFTDYASQNKHGTVKPSLINGIIVDSDGVIGIVPSTDAQLKSKNSNNRPIISKQIDYVSVQSAHQEMSNDYDPSTAVTPDGNVPYAYGDRQPVSYAAVKKYIDDTYNFWRDKEIDFECTIEEAVGVVEISEINGEPFAFDELRVFVLVPDRSDKTYILIRSSKQDTFYASSNVVSTGVTGKVSFHIFRDLGRWTYTFKQSKGTTPSYWDKNGDPVYGKNMLSEGKGIGAPSLGFGDTINSIYITGNFQPGAIIRIWGKPARKGATT